HTRFSRDWSSDVCSSDLHGLDFSLSPHALLREAARSVRPGGHLLIVGVNPWSAWGATRLVSRKAFRHARCIRPTRVSDWLNLLEIGRASCRERVQPRGVA